MPLAAGWTEPDRRPEAIAFNCAKGGNPEKLLGVLAGKHSQRLGAAVSSGDDQDPKLGVLKLLFKLSRGGKAQVGFSLGFPYFGCLASQIDLKEAADSAGGWSVQNIHPE